MQDAPGSLSIFLTLTVKAATSLQSGGSFSLMAFGNRDLWVWVSMLGLWLQPSLPVVR